MAIVSGLFMTLTGYRTICGGIRGDFDARLVGGISVNVGEFFWRFAIDVLVLLRVATWNRVGIMMKAFKPWLGDNVQILIKYTNITLGQLVNIYEKKTFKTFEPHNIIVK